MKKPTAWRRMRRFVVKIKHNKKLSKRKQKWLYRILVRKMRRVK